jgi:hypothetical protein
VKCVRQIFTCTDFDIDQMNLAMRSTNFIFVLFSLLTFLCFSVKISQPYKSDVVEQYYLVSLEIIFGISFVPKYCSDLPDFKNFIFRLCPFPLPMKFYT